ncbi:MAG: hypothetical protein ACJ76Y_23710 [Thermoanaerobaculia bacterium]
MKAAVAQPLILVAGGRSSDYAIMKVLYNLRKYNKDERIMAIENLDGTVTLGTSENVYIVGHGSPGEIWSESDRSETVGLQSVGSTLYDVIYEVDNWQGEIRILTCRSDIKDDNDASARDLLDKGLGEDENIVVRGTKGFSYGTPDTATTGLTSVLKPKLEVFYKDTWGESQHEMANSFGPILENLKEDDKDFAPQTQRRKKEGLHKPTSAKEAAKAWVTVRDLIESDMKTLVENASENGGKTIEKTLEALGKNKTWQKLLDEQHLEFTHYNMFAEKEDAFTPLKD